MREAVLRLSGVTFSYDRHPVLEGIDLEVAAGEFLGLIGPNGSGKSTLVQLSLGRLSPDAGSVYLFGEPVEKFRKWHRIGYVSQKSNSFNLGFPATVYEVVASGLTGKLGLFRRIGKKERALIRDTLERLGLSDIAGANIGRLSGGQQQRTFIARALVSRPELLILDEPTVGVDAESVNQFYRLLDRLHREEDLTILLITHDIDEITAAADRIALLNRRIRFCGTPQEFAARRGEVLWVEDGRDVSHASRVPGEEIRV
ncbi:metal ABC transporter ATP-binding protein [Planifilum fimeticola]